MYHFISAGHSNTDPGAVAKHGNVVYKEAVYTARLRNIVAAECRSLGLQVSTDGVGENNSPRDAAIALARKASGLQLDIHFNAATPQARGVEVIAEPSMKAWATRLAACVAEVLDSPLRGKGGWIQEEQSARGRLAWMRLPRALLLEVCFISNEEEFRRYREREQAVGQTIARVVAEYEDSFTKP